ncbi:MAG: hypothetical protein P8Y43_08430 [Sulfurovaceae bacterium]
MAVSVGVTYTMGKMASAGIALSYISAMVGAIFFFVALYAFVLRDKIDIGKSFNEI